jgi:hypothetical protein
LSPRRVVAISGSDTEEEEENVEKTHEEKDEENYEENDEENDEENEEENEEEVMAKQISQLSAMSMSDSGHEDDAKRKENVVRRGVSSASGTTAR